MTTPATPVIAGPFVGNGTAAVLPFSFPAYAATDLLVTRDGTVLTYGTDYTVTLNTDQINTPGGAVTMVAAANTAGTKIFVELDMDVMQPTQLTALGPYSPKAVEGAMDRLALLIAQLKASVSRAILVHRGDETLTDIDDIIALVLAAGPQFFVGNLDTTAPTRAGLALISAVDGQAALLTEAGRTGVFVFSTANLTAKVASDPNQGVYVAPTSDPTGASGAWVRQINGPHNVKWFGAVGDNVTDDGPAFLAAIAYLKANILASGYGYGRGNASLFVPAGFYYLGTSTLDFDFTCRMKGEGTGLPGAGITVLRWAAGATGIRTQSYITAGGTDVVASEPGFPSGSGSIFEGLFLKGGYANDGVEAEEHGFHFRAMAVIRDCFVQGFKGNGIHIAAAAGTGVPLEGNANVSRIENVTVQHCRVGIYFDSADSNACLITSANCTANRTWGIWDSSFLGNTYIGCHTAANGWDGARTSIPTACTYSGNRYYVKAGQAAGASTNPPSGTTAGNTWWGYIGEGGTYNGVVEWVSGTTFREGGAYYADGESSQNVFVGCYSEGDQNPIQAITPSMFLGGLFGIVNGGGPSLQGYFGAVGSRQGFKAFNANGNNVGMLPSGIYYQHSTAGNYSLQYVGNDLVWTYANSAISTNWAYRLTGEGTASPVGARRIDFPNGYGLAGKKVLSGTAPPGSGTYAVGDMMWNSAPAAGGIPGWVCVTAGTPGTWKAMAVLAA